MQAWVLRARACVYAGADGRAQWSLCPLRSPNLEHQCQRPHGSKCQSRHVQKRARRESGTSVPVQQPPN